MIGNLSLTTLCALIFCPAFAQTSATEEKVEYSKDEYKVETNRFQSNWPISVGGDVQIHFDDHDKQVSLSRRLAPALDAAVGRWSTPEIDMRLMYSGLQQKGATQKGALSHSTNSDVPGKGGNGYWLEKQKFDVTSFHTDILLNFSNLFYGYNEKRIWNCSPYTDLGWARVWESPSAKEISTNVGVLSSLRLYSALDLNLDVRAMFVSDRFDGEDGGRFNEGMLSVTVGLAYKFKPRDWGRSKTIYCYNYGDLESMCRKLNEVSAENECLKRALAEGNVQDVRTVIKKIATASLVTSPINKSRLDSEARANLGTLAGIIKSGDPKATYTITGHADTGIGSKKGNEELSKERVHAVYNYLIKEFGVRESQLRIDYRGGAEDMFCNDPHLGHAVTTRSE